MDGAATVLANHKPQAMPAQRRPALPGAYHPDTSRKISRMPAYMEIIRESERKKLLEKPQSAMDKYLIWARRCSRRLRAGVVSAAARASRKGTKSAARAHSREDLISEAKDLCRDYIRHRLMRSGLSLRRNLDWLSAPADCDSREELLLVGEELEIMYPDLFQDVLKQLNLALTSEESVRKVFVTFAEQLCRDGLHWGKVVALFAMAGALADDCVQQDRDELLPNICDAFAAFTAMKLCDWLKIQGGWKRLAQVTRRSHMKNDRTLFWICCSCLALAFFLATATIAAVA